MQETSLVSFSGVFALRDGVSEEEFLPGAWGWTCGDESLLVS
jgi:hypothetical protein